MIKISPKPNNLPNVLNREGSLLKMPLPRALAHALHLPRPRRTIPPPPLPRR